MEQLGNLEERVRNGRIDRRRFMEYAIALGVGIPAATTFWSANAGANVPKSGGLFRVALDDGNTTDSLDPATYSSRFSSEEFGLVVTCSERDVAEIDGLLRTHQASEVTLVEP